ncbi:MAG: hypothetical protein U0359_10365 [Byssovorax sp.]
MAPSALVTVAEPGGAITCPPRDTLEPVRRLDDAERGTMVRV